jgi:energy-coupling factor transporter transmembrane protein EcfT
VARPDPPHGAGATPALDRVHALLTDPRGGLLALAVCAVFLARTDMAGILGALAVVPVLGAWHAGRTALVQGLRSVRYLALAALVLHGWWGSGDALWPGAGALSPRADGLAAGLRQVAILGVLAVAARAVVIGTPRPRLLAGLHALLAPLGATGISRARVALRIALTVEIALALVAAGSRAALAQTYRGARDGAPGDAPLPPLPPLGARWHALAAPVFTAAGLCAAGALVRSTAFV